MAGLRNNTIILVGVLLLFVITFLGIFRTMGAESGMVGGAMSEQPYNTLALFGGNASALAAVPPAVLQELERLRRANSRLESAAMLGDGSKHLDRIEELEERLALLVAADQENAPDDHKKDALVPIRDDPEDSPDASDFAAARAVAASVAEAEAEAEATKAALRELQTRHDGLQRRHDVLSQRVRASPGGAAMLATAPPLPAAPAPPPAAPLAAAAKAAAKQQQQLLQLPPAYGAASEKSATAKTPRGPRLIGPYPPRPELMQEHNISKASLTDPAHRAGFEAWQFAKEFMAQRIGFPSSATLNAINAQTSGSGVGSSSAASPPASPASSWAGMATSLKTTSTTSSTTQPPPATSKSLAVAGGGGGGTGTGTGSKRCGSWLKVYVYEFPESLIFNQYAAQYLKQCRETRNCNSQYGGENLLAQFSLELILHDFFKQSCVRTMDPEEAHLFYVPFYNDVEYRWEGKRPNEASKFGQAILNILEKKDTRAWEKHFQVTGKYWERKWGADHIITMSAPVTGLRHPKGTRGWGHYMLFLEQPIFLNLELTKSFVHEYPKCAEKNIIVPYPIPGRNWHNGVWRRKAEKLFGLAANASSSSTASSSSAAAASSSSAFASAAVETVPNPARELQRHLGSPGFELPSVAASPSSSSSATAKERVPVRVLQKPIFTYYSGGNHGCTNVRQAINREVQNDERCLGAEQRRSLGSSYRRQNPKEPFDHKNGPPRQVAMAGAKFCACPEGDSPSAKRQYDAVLTGCIPVIVSNEALYAYSTENGGLLDPKDFSVRVTEESVVEAKGGKEGAAPKQGGLLQQLEAIDEREVRRLQRNLHRAAHFFRYYAEHDAEQDPGYYRASEGTAQAMVVNGHPVDPLVAGRFPDGGATEMLLAELERRADGGLAAACKKERAEPHYYLRMQHCGRAAAGKEIANLERQLTQQKEGSRRFVEIMKGITAYKEGWISRRRRRRRRR